MTICIGYCRGYLAILSVAQLKDILTAYTSQGVTIQVNREVIYKLTFVQSINTLLMYQVAPILTG